MDNVGAGADVLTEGSIAAPGKAAELAGVVSEGAVVSPEQPATSNNAVPSKTRSTAYRYFIEDDPIGIVGFFHGGPADLELGEQAVGQTSTVVG